MASKKYSVDRTGGYDFGPTASPRMPVSQLLLGGTVVDKGFVRRSPDYSRFPDPGYPAYDADFAPLPKKLTGRRLATAQGFESLLEGLGDTSAPPGSPPGTTVKFGRVRTAITGVPAIDTAIFDAEDQLDDLKSAMTLQSAASVFTIIGLAYLILRRR